jgi:hypothetical protein
MRASSFQSHRAVLTGRRPEGSLFMAMDTMPSALHVAFRTALLLTGDMRTAEAAVMHGIGVCEDLSPGGLLIAAVRSAVRRRTKSSDGPCKVECLSPELRCLFMLQPLPRHCFVLRVLVGLSPEACAELLEVSVTEFEDAVYRALTQLPLLCSPRAQPTGY